MTVSLLSNKELLLAVIPGEDGEQVVRYASVNGRRIVAAGEGVPSRSAAPTQVSLFSPDSYFEQVDLAAAWSKLEEYAARLTLVIHSARWAAEDPDLENPDVVDKANTKHGTDMMMSRPE